MTTRISWHSFIHMISIGLSWTCRCLTMSWNSIKSPLWLHRRSTLPLDNSDQVRQKGFEMVSGVFCSLAPTMTWWDSESWKKSVCSVWTWQMVSRTDAEIKQLLAASSVSGAFFSLEKERQWPHGSGNVITDTEITLLHSQEDQFLNSAGRVEHRFTTVRPSWTLPVPQSELLTILLCFITPLSSVSLSLLWRTVKPGGFLRTWHLHRTGRTDVTDLETWTEALKAPCWHTSSLPNDPWKWLRVPGVQQTTL